MLDSTDQFFIFAHVYLACAWADWIQFFELFLEQISPEEIILKKYRREWSHEYVDKKVETVMESTNITQGCPKIVANTLFYLQVIVDYEMVTDSLLCCPSIAISSYHWEVLQVIRNTAKRINDFVRNL